MTEPKPCTPIPCPSLADLYVTVEPWVPTLDELRQAGAAIMQPDGSCYVERDGQVVHLPPEPVAPLAERRPFVTVVDFLKALHEAGLLPQYPMLSRVVIDADVDKGVVNMYVDQIPSGALLTIAPLMKVAMERLDDGAENNP